MSTKLLASIAPLFNTSPLISIFILFLANISLVSTFNHLSGDVILILFEYIDPSCEASTFLLE